MTKKTLDRTMLILAVLSAVAFVIRIVVLAAEYHRSFTSAPFWVWVLPHAVGWLIFLLVLTVLWLLLRRFSCKK